MFGLILFSMSILLTRVISDVPTRLGPVFVEEPPAAVRFAASSGGRVHCAARGQPSPRVAWFADDGSPIVDVPGIRRVYSNGTLEVFPSSAYRDETTLIRCRATNAHGTIVSRDVLLQPVADVNWEVTLTAEAAVAGGVAALQCRAGAAPATPALWYRGDRVLHVDRPTPEFSEWHAFGYMGSTVTTFSYPLDTVDCESVNEPESRYLVAGNTLLIRDVSTTDAGAYSCLARHHLTALTKRSSPAHLTVLPSSMSSAPQLVATAGEVAVAAGTQFCVPCVAPDYPAPQYTWYREKDGRLQPVEPSAGAWLWSGGAALCFARSSGDITGAWLCKAYNVFGDATAQLRIDVEDTFSVTVSPIVVVAEAGSTVQFNCSSSAAAALRWLHDGTPLSAGDTLELRRVSRAHAGAYQCVARRGRRQEQASAELRLGDSPPELQYTFIEQALRAGASVALRCAALAQPPPHIKWLLDGQPVDHYLAHHRFSISEESSPQGEVVSVLNVTAATAGDGGLYTCRASNPLGAIEHSARLNIYGPPSIRPMGIVRAVAGDNFTLHCPYAGYPISSVTWRRRGGAALGGEDARAGARGAALRLWPARAHDAGHYTCSAAAPSHPTAHRDVEIQVRNPPKISPFMFSSELTEGSSVQVLCGVSSGDKPMYFSWLKDGAPLPPNLQIEEKSLNEFSLLMFPELSARHSGAYTCRVANHAAAVDYTATLSVKVAPSWVTEPLDAAVLVGAPLRLTCAARGHPSPTVTWYRKTQGDGLESMDNSEKWEVATFSSEWGSNGEGVTSSSGAGSSVISAPAATRALAGRYRCSADNGVGAALVKHVNVSVHEPAHFEPLSDAVRNVSSVRGRSVVLSCLAMGDPPLTVHWTHRGNKLDLDSFRWSVSELRAGGGTRSSLRLAAAERGDAGEYRCHARNHYGRADQLILLHVEEPPEAPQRPRLGGAGSRWVRVSWRARTSPQTRYAALCAPADTPAPAALHTYNMTLDTAPGRRSDSEELELLSARLDGLKPASAYTLRIVATNHVGESPHSEALLFTTLEEAPSASPQSIRVRPINSEELHISWSAPARDTWNGELLGYAVSWREMGPPPEDIEEEGSGEPRVGTAVARGWSSAEMTVAGLRPWARYALAVRAFNRAGPGPPSPTAYATTADGVPSEAPSGVSCVAASARSLRVRWRAPALPQLRGYDVHYAPVHEAPSWSGEGGSAAARVTGGATGEALLQGLHAAANYSVRVRARSAAGAGPPSPPTYCATPHDVPGAPEAIRALPAGVDSVRVTWLPPADTGGQLTHYTVYTRELGKVGGEWTQRVDASGEATEEMWRDVRGLREHAAYELWVRAASAAGEGPPSRAVSAAPATPIAARISSIGRLVTAALGARVRLRCSALGMPPLARVWSPLPQAHTVTDAGDLVIHKLDVQWAMNYTCAVRNGAGADVTQWAVRALRTPAAPSPRLARADSTALHLAWDPPHDGGAPLLGYTVWWWRAWELPSNSKKILSDEDAAGRQRRVAGAARGAALRGLACGAPYRVAVRAHNALGASPLSPALTLRTRGDKAKAPSGKECIWANATALRVSLLAWGGRCPVARWSVALRPAGAAPWTHLHADGDVAEVNNLEPGTWYEIRVEAHSPAGDSPALYKAATHTLNGERIGEPIDLPLEARLSAADEPGESYAVWWRGGAAALAGLALALGAAVATLAARRRTAPQTCAHPLYVAQPTHHNGKTVSPPDGSLNEISPYATFSMSEAEGERACGLHVRAARELPLAAPPPRPRLLAHPNDYGCARDSDSESSGSPCAACAAELYRLPAAHMSETLPVGAAESSTEDGSYAAGACAGAARRREVQARPRARRRDHTRPSPTVRYSPRRSLPREELRSNLL